MRNLWQLASALVLGAAIAASAGVPVSLKVDDVTGVRGGVVDVAIRITSAPLTVVDDVRSYQFHLAYDPAMLAPVAVTFNLTLASGSDVQVATNIDKLKIDPRTEPLVKVAVAAPTPRAGSNLLAVVRFTVLGASGSETELYLSDVLFNENAELVSELVPGIVTAENRPPVIQPIPLIKVVVGQTMDVTVRATDPDGDVPVTFSIEFTQGTPKFGINSATGVIKYTPVIADTGTYVATITATDSKDASSTAVLTVVVDRDRTPPVITQGPFAQGISTTQATIGWKTNEPATSIVRYGLPGGQLTPVSDSRLVIDHVVILTGLNPGTTYNFEVQSVDDVGNASEVKTGQFPTEPDVIILPLVLTKSVAVDRADTYAYVKWETNRYSSSVVRYGTAAATYTDSATGAAGTSHNVAMSGLTSGTKYFYSVRSVDAFGLAVASRDTFFVTRVVLAPLAFTLPPSAPSVSDNSFTVTWQTNRASSSILQYGTTSAYGTTIVTDTVSGVTVHNVAVTGLQAKTEYHYRAGSRPPEGGDPIFSGDQVVTTLQQADTQPPQWVKRPQVPNPGYESAIIVFETDEDSRFVVEYGVFSFGAQFAYTNKIERTELRRRHEVQLLNLTSVTAYRYRVRVFDLYSNGPTEAVDLFATTDVPDTKPPVILNNRVAVTATQNSATVQWLTDESADSKVIFQVAGSELTDDVFDAGLVTDHSMALRNLDPNTRYSLTVVTADASGNSTTAGTGVTTKAQPDTLPPVVVAEPKVESQTLTDANLVNVTLTAGTDELAIATLRYGLSPTELGGSVSTGAFDRTHRFTITNLPPSTTIHFQITYVDASERQNTRVGLLRRFNTITGLDMTPPMITSGPLVVSVEPYAFTVEWTTDEASTSRLRVAIDPTTIKDVTPVVDGTLVQRHRMTATNLVPGTTYYWRVASDDASQNRVVSTVSRATTSLDADTIPPVFTVYPTVLYTSDNVAIIRGANDENTVWDVYIAAKSAEYFDVITDDVFKRRHNIALVNLEAGQEYVYFVEATDGSGNSAVAGDSAAPEFNKSAIERLADGRVRISREAQGRTGGFQTAATADQTFPVITTQPKVVGTSTTTTTVTWGTDETANSVVRFIPESEAAKLTRGAAITQDQMVNNGTPVTLTDYVTGHQITVTGLQPNTPYIMMSSSTDPVGNGETHSSFIYLTTPQTADLSPPVIISGSIGAVPTQTQAVVTWDTDEPADGRVDYGLSMDALTGSRTDPDPVQDHQITLTNLLSDTIYYYTVSSTDIRGNGPTTSAVQSFVSFRTLKEADVTPPVVSGVTLKRVGDTTATITWTTDEFAGTYIEYGLTTGFGRTVINPTARTSHEVTLTGLVSLTKYYFRVEATDQVGNTSGYTATDSLTTASAPDTEGPNAPAVVDTIPASGRVVLRWTKSTSPDIASYTVYRNGSPLATGVGDTTYQDRAVQNDVTYTYEIAGVDVGGNVGAKTAAVRETPSATESPSMPTPLLPLYWVTQDSVLRITVGNSTPAASRPTDVLVYSFVLAGDSLLANTVATASGVPQGTGGTTSWTVAGYQLTPGEDYFWAAQAQGSISTSPITPSVKFIWTPTAIQLASFAASGDGNGTVRVTWQLRVNETAISEVALLRGAEAGSAGIVKVLGPEGLSGDVRDLMATAIATPTYWLRVKEHAGTSTTFGPVTAANVFPTAWAISPARPNPFNPTTEILLSVPSLDEASVLVYNILGQPVATLWSGPITPGVHRLRWNAVDREGRAVASGLYIVRLRTASGITRTQRVTMLR